MTDTKVITDLGKSNKEVETAVVQGRSSITYVLAGVALIIVAYLGYTRWLCHQEFFKGKGKKSKKKSPKEEEEPDSDDEEEPPKKIDDDDDFDMQGEIKKLERLQEKLIADKD